MFAAVGTSVRVLHCLIEAEANGMGAKTRLSLGAGCGAPDSPVCVVVLDEDLEGDRQRATDGDECAGSVEVGVRLSEQAGFFFVKPECEELVESPQGDELLLGQDQIELLLLGESGHASSFLISVIFVPWRTSVQPFWMLESRNFSVRNP